MAGALNGSSANHVTIAHRVDSPATKPRDERSAYKAVRNRDRIEASFRTLQLRASVYSPMPKFSALLVKNHRP